MPRRDLYQILGVSAGAAPAEIKRAYRRIAFDLHPDVGGRADPERFREAHEAYEILSDPERRRFYDVGISIGRRPLSVEPLRARAPVTVVEDFLKGRPSIQELLDQIGQNFFGYRKKSAGPLRRLGVEAIIDAEEARFGCRVPFSVPCCISCRRCRSTGDWWGLCPDCYGRGFIESTCEFVLEIPAGARQEDGLEVDLSGGGISNLLLEVRVIVV